MERGRSAWTAGVAAWCLLACATVCWTACGSADGAPATDAVEPGDAAADAPFDPGPMPFCPVDEAQVDALAASMDLRGQIGQHLLVSMNRAGTRPDAATRRLIDEGLVGAAYVRPPAIDLDDAAGLATFLYELQVAAIAATGLPLLIATDHEGGYNAMINAMTGGTDTLGNAALGAADDMAIALAQYDLMGRELRALGFNMDFAPAIDTCPSTRNGNLNTRTFGPDPARNARLARAAVAGLQRNLVVAVAKHFPGDGITDGNPHVEPVTVTADRATLDALSLPPFQAAVDAGVEGVMTMPARFAALDPVRAALASRPVTTDLLRRDMGHDRLVVTDALWMAGASIGLAEGEDLMIEALRAGADVLLLSDAGPDVVLPIAERIEAALRDGTLDRDAFDASTRRILRAKMRFCLPRDGARPTAEERAVLAGNVSRPDDAGMSRAHALAAITRIEDDGTALPLAGRVVYAGPGTFILSDPGSTWPNLLDSTLGDALRDRGLDVTDVTWTLPMDPESGRDNVLAAAAGADVVVLATLQGWFSPDQMQLVEWLVAACPVPLVQVSLGVPFDHAQTRGRVAAGLALLNARGPSLKAAADVLAGDVAAGGTLPWDLDAIPWGAPYPGADRCRDDAVDCDGAGTCFDHHSVHGCACAVGFVPSGDGPGCAGR